MSDAPGHNVAFVRTEEIPPSPPPASASGPLGWLRTNLFSSIPYSILTLLSLYLVYWVLNATLPWMLNGVWVADSLSQCREIFFVGSLLDWQLSVIEVAEAQQLSGAAGARLDELLTGVRDSGVWAAGPEAIRSDPALQSQLGSGVGQIDDIARLLSANGVDVDARPSFPACWAVLTERWNQLLFGFTYPREMYWRPALAFLLLLVSAAPVLFAFLPRKLLILTALYPFIAYFLVWGGSIWTPILVGVGFVVGYMVYTRLVTQSFAMGLFGGVGAAMVFWALRGYMQMPFDAIAPVALEAVPSRDMGGFMLNMILGTVCISLSLPIGIALALGRQSSMPIIKWICVIFIEFVRGVPLITLLFVANVVLAYFLPPGTSFDLILRVIIMITMFASAYIAEVIRGGLAALPRGQYEAADSLGLDYPQAMRLIILPQALKISIPGIVNVAVGLFKDTTLVSVISMFDLVGMIRGPILASTDWKGVYWELFGFAALLFFVVCYGISQYSQWLERQLATDHR